MGTCSHPRSQQWDDNGVARCGACGDMWDEQRKEWVTYPGLEAVTALNDKPIVPRPGMTLEDEYRSLSEDFLALEERYERMTEQSKVQPRVVVVDVRHGKVRADGVNIDLPPEGQQSALRSLETADVIVEVHEDTVYVKHGYDKHIVLLVETKSEHQMNAEKAAADLDNRTNSLYDDLKSGEHPVEVKMKRVWDKNDPGYVESGEPEERGLKGY